MKKVFREEEEYASGHSGVNHLACRLERELSPH